MPDMHTAIPCIGSTADQAVSTIHVQLGAAKHLTRPLTDIVSSTLRVLLDYDLPTEVSFAFLLKFLFSFALTVRQKLLLPAITILLCREPDPALQIRMHKTLASVMYQGVNLVCARHQM